MDNLKMHTPNKVDENVEKIGALFPNAITETIKGYNDDGSPIIERVIDFDILKQELSNVVVEGNEERYQFTWPDKKKSILLANAPIAKTLRPCREESVNFDMTKNLYIEGDNLDVLKLLQETYLNKVKMIYIDPPYNTGSDFVYEDDFAQSTEEYLANSGQFDEDENRLVQNAESNGRFHTDWLNMIYPRLKLAKDLLADDGVIFISIDDNENDNLKKMCNEIFGSINFVAQLVWQKKTGSSDAVNIATITEYVLVYAKSLSNLVLRQNTEACDETRYRYKDAYFSERGPFYYDNLDRGTLGYHVSLDYSVRASDGKLVFPNGRTKQFNDGWRWKWSKDKLLWGIDNGFIELQKNASKDCGWGVYYKIYLNVDNEGNRIVRSSPFKNLLQGILNTHASNEAKEIFGRTGYFSNPKPVELIKKLVFMATDSNSQILDFFSGSATTAHAVMQLNAEDGGNRKFVMVQLPEETDESSEANKAGYKNICEIGKERIRRAGKKIKEEAGLTAQNLDIGFRVLKVDSTNMKDVFYNPSEYTQNLLSGLEDNFKDERTPEDLLFQVMLDLGVPLSSKIEEKVIAGKKVFAVAENYLIACFDKNVNDEVVTAIAKQKPYYAVFRDIGIATDSVATNFEQIFATFSPTTVRKVL